MDHKRLSTIVAGFGAEKEPMSDTTYENLKAPPPRAALVSESVLSQPTMLPSAKLQPRQKKELLRLISAVFTSGDSCPRMVMVAGVDNAASSEWIAACAGDLLARQSGENVCLVDGNLRRGGLHRLFGLSPEPGLSDVLLGDALLLGSCRPVYEKLWVLSAGSPLNCEHVLASGSAGPLLEQLQREYPFCLIVCPPIIHSLDVLVLARTLEGVLLVIDAETTRREAALMAKEILATASVPLLGAVLNNRGFPIPDWLYERL